MERRAFLQALGLLLCDAARAGAAPDVLCVQPLGDELPEASTALVVAALRAFFAAEVRLLPRCALPQAAYYPARRRYRADRLLDFLTPRLPAGATHILGLTGVDISTTKGRYADWGVLGLGAIGGAACVISAFRCGRGARGEAHARERLGKVAVHEIGHTQGLEHCPTRGCLMEDAEGQVASTDREYDLCPRCRALLAQAGRAAPPEPRIPWPRPRP